tara:strand:- start:486 stop:1676 length:1191 start_codon:yes stop_codon:yes gene_type:complete
MAEKGFSNLGHNQWLLTKIDPRQRAWLEVSSGAIEGNARILKDLIGENCLLMAVVKADGYGHGAETVARAALLGGASCLGVATLQEGIELRKSGLVCPILLLGSLSNVDELSSSLHWDLMPTLSGIREAMLCHNLAEATGKKFKVHLKIDTGMSRLGCHLNEAIQVVNAIDRLDNLSLEGIYSHLAMADGPLEEESKKVTFSQQKKFESLLDCLKSRKHSLCFHLANSAGTIRDKGLHYNMVRVGLALYGYNPLDQASFANSLLLQPAMSVKARITLIRDVPVGTGVGYGHSFKTTRNSRLAVVGIGYADGVSRALSGKISALFKGDLLPQVGAITMDQLVLDITDKPELKIGNIVTLLGCEGPKSISARHWSDLSGSIPWEVLCGFKHRLPRVVV